MTLSRKTSIIISTIGVLAWSSLFAFFYWGSEEYGTYPNIDFGSVRGAAVERFTLSVQDVVLASSRATGAFESDTLLVARRAGTEGVRVYVVRDENLLYEKTFENGRFEAVWDETLDRFGLINTKSGESFLFIPGEHTYILEIAP
ncbi:MAG: hypothetical protein HYT31_01030 [Parcubacteria group bacterium]|nr:hypothetical protein [Parcubacteria group bacterium]